MLELINKINKIFYRFILPFVVLIVVFSYNVKAGFYAMLLFFVYLLYKSRTSLLSFTGQVLYANGNIDKAIIWYSRAYGTGILKAKPKVSYAYMLLKKGRIEEAEDVLNKLLKSPITLDDAMYAKSNLALVLWKKGELDGAIEILEKVFEQYVNSTVYGSLGYLLILKGDLERALKFNLEAYEYNSANSVICDNLGQTYYMMGEYEKALGIFETLIAANPTFPEAYYNYGLVLSKLGQNDKALEMLIKSTGFKFSFLSNISKEEIEEKIAEVKSLLEQ